MNIYYGSALFVILLFTVMALFRYKYYGFSKRKAVLLSLLTSLYGILGFRILYIIQDPHATILSIQGFSYYGAVFLVPVFMGITARLMKESIGKCLDYASVGGSLAIMFGRIGCFCSGCCGAYPIDFFGKSVVPPIQLIESGCNAVIAFILLLIERKNWKIADGELYCKFMMMYGFVRLIMENYRRSEKDLYGLSEAQWFSIAAMAIGFIVHYIIRRRQSRTCVQSYSS